MKKDEFARELMLQEVKRESGHFITQRIVDRLVLFYAPLFEWKYLNDIAVKVNAESRSQPGEGGGTAAEQNEGLAPMPLAKAVNG